jgi:phosphate transport system protein
MAVYRPLDEALPALTGLLIRMSELVSDQFTEAVDALVRCDTALAEQVRRRDDEVDAMELEVDRMAERVLALYQPVAGDLRALLIAVKINTDLERIGDHAKNIAKDVPHVACAPGAIQSTHLTEMADAVRKMLHEAHESFRQRDRAMASRVMAYDREVDRLHKSNFAALEAHVLAHPADFKAAAHLLTASKSMERIADHAKNVARGVVFIMEGEDLRHMKQQRRAAEASAAPAAPQAAFEDDDLA